MFVDVLHLQELKEYDLSSLTTTLMGGAPCPLELAKSLNTVLNVKNVMVRIVGCLSYFIPFLT